MNKTKIIIIILLMIGITSYKNEVVAAEKVRFAASLFNRTVDINDIDSLASTGKSRGLLKSMIKLSNTTEKEVSDLLNQEFDLPLVTTSKLMYSEIGQVIILRISKIIYPLNTRNPSVSVPAIRAGVTKSLIAGNGKMTLNSFLKNYPNKTITINIPALLKVLNKVESIADLVNFFSNSPLEVTKKGPTID